MIVSAYWARSLPQKFSAYYQALLRGSRSVENEGRISQGLASYEYMAAGSKKLDYSQVSKKLEDARVYRQRDLRRLWHVV